VSVRRGERPSDPGTVSPDYGRYTPSHVVEARIVAAAPCWVVTVVDVLDSADSARGGVQLLPLQAPGAPVGVVSRRGSATDVTICRGRSPRALVTCSVGEASLATDARMAHVRVDREGRPVRLCVADATVVRYDGPRSVSLTSDDPLTDLAAVFTGHGAPIVETSAARRGFSLDVDEAPAGARPRGPRRPPGREAPAGTR
jgi:hypothetical protein